MQKNRLFVYALALIGACTGVHAGSVSAAEKAAPAYTATADGLKYVDVRKGTGASPKTGDLVTVKYVGSLENGTVFDRSADHVSPQNPDGTFSFHIGQGEVIKGWDEGVGSMRPGGRRKLIIPANLGYGEAGAGNAIPPNATLIFDVTLVKTERAR